jgi:thioredoxin 1
MNIDKTPTLVYYKDGVLSESLEGGLKEPNTTTGYSIERFKEFFNLHKPEGND